MDTRKPYRVYGGLQDNGSWGGPSRTLRGTGPANEDWVFLNGGDGFVCQVDQTDPDWVYAESQNGGINRRNLKTGESGFMRPRPVKAGEALRFNWNTPFILSHHNSRIFYSGAQYMFRLGGARRQPEGDQPRTDAHEGRHHLGHRRKPEERGGAMGR